MKERHELGRAISYVLVGLACRFALGLPARSGVGDGSKRTRLVEAPHRQSQLLLPLRVSALDQLFLGIASGSTTSTTPPPLRLRFTLPVSHQLRVSCQLKPASRNTFQMV
jgi:hypothetical protein